MIKQLLQKLITSFTLVQHMTFDQLLHYLTNHYKDWSADDVYGECYNACLHFIYHLRKHKVKGWDLVHLTKYQGGDLPRLHPQWCYQTDWHHHVVLFNTICYDFTFKQFDSDAPGLVKRSLVDLSQDWGNILVESYHWYQSDIPYYSDHQKRLKET